ncbi:hypothetical protein Poli38472_004128 [Pythium oligandrum]|uniref:PNPLA domain-containing protein n=1 Tax=Pythium oligandrum TaxID=41045 RepID=A0A8K1CNX6_PYTOL|nr:hypothetical protein Poli38472_004128 [Pythium oligandrum]|eukprot:TMW66363.1 hypothetical protein Poli38472_004128 [Pythium oligandrum]
MKINLRCFSTSDLATATDKRVAELKERLKDSPPAAHNFSFSGSGFLIAYHLGVAHALKELGYIQEDSRLAGASGGSIAALAVASNADLHQILDDTKLMAHFGRTVGTWGKLEPGLRKLFYDRFANVDLEHLAKRLAITTHQVWPIRQIIHSVHFESPDDLCDNLIASCYVPFYLSSQAVVKLRGQYHVDGGLLKLVPEIPDHVRVCVFHANMLRRTDYEISPSLDSEFPHPFFHLVRIALFPPEAHVLDDLFHYGRRGAVLWAEKQLEQEKQQ